MPRSVNKKKYASRWANEAATLAKTLTKRRYDHDNNATTQHTEEAGASPPSVVDKRNEKQATQDEERDVPNLTKDTKASKKKTRPVHGQKEVASDESSSDEWRPYSRHRKRHKKKHTTSGRKKSTSRSTTSSSSFSERDERKHSAMKETKSPPHQITFTFSPSTPATPSTDQDNIDGNTSTNQISSHVELEETTSDDTKNQSELDTSSNIKPYTVWSDFCAKLDRELKENRRRQDKLKAKLKYNADKTYKEYVAKKETTGSKETSTKEVKGFLGKTKSTVIEKNLPSSQSIPVEAKTNINPLEKSKGSGGLETTSQRRVDTKVAKRATMSRTTSQATSESGSVKRSALLMSALPKVSANSFSKHPPLSAAAKSWTSEHRRRLVVQWLKTLQKPANRTANKKPAVSPTVHPQSTLTDPSPPQHEPKSSISPHSDKGPESDKTTQQLAMGAADMAKNKAPGDKPVQHEGENADISDSVPKSPSSQCHCEAVSVIDKGTAGGVQSEDTLDTTTKPQHSVWSSDSESNSSSDNKVSDQQNTGNNESSNTTLEDANTQLTTTEEKGNDKKSK
ncbi:dentin sialophosphoprotein-like isoform X1 [Branchiostoma floridae]|uniref:Dentin sialophosphoprotein-like isoform X1 n=1 Tax=Branchiostoma floridae TaxID=7739 RepID=A0A9J7MX30_BRAFL|nr:dentin sialophosphoprotein-like isoform X1 [Branchiostoma floridae]